MSMAPYDASKFVVIPTKYLDDLSITSRGHLVAVLEAIHKLREAQGKTSQPAYFVCNQDEHYAHKVLGVILAGEAEKT